MHPDEKRERCAVSHQSLWLPLGQLRRAYTQAGSVLRGCLSPLLSPRLPGDRWFFSPSSPPMSSARPQEARAGDALESAGWAQHAGSGMCALLPTLRATCGPVRQDCQGPSSRACSPAHLDELLRGPKNRSRSTEQPGSIQRTEAIAQSGPAPQPPEPASLCTRREEA